MYLEKLECVTKTTYDVTHNANFERVILINVTDITLKVSDDYCSSNFSVYNGHVSCRQYEKGEWIDKILFSDAQTAILFLNILW